jgi:hypothetical protein
MSLCDVIRDLREAMFSASSYPGIGSGDGWAPNARPPVVLAPSDKISPRDAKRQKRIQRLRWRVSRWYREGA